MLVTNVSTLTGKEHTLELDVTIDQLGEYFNPNPKRRSAQYIFPNLKDYEREFIMSGITKEEWDAAFPEEDEEQDFPDLYDEPNCEFYRDKKP